MFISFILLPPLQFALHRHILVYTYYLYHWLILNPY